MVFCTMMLAPAPSATADSSRSHFSNCQPNTGTNATVVLQPSAGLFFLNTPGAFELLRSGDEVAAFTPQGRCVGNITWKGGVQALTMRGDDPMTPEKDGYRPGDLIIFRAWSTASQKEYTSVLIQYRDVFDTSGNYHTDAIYMPRLIYFYPTDRGGGIPREGLDLARAAEEARTEAVARTASRVAIPDAFTLASNYPNPFAVSTTLRYGLPEAADVRLDVYDALGRRVATLVDENQPAAWHEVEFRAGDLAPGVYLYRLRANDFVSQRQLLLVR